MIVVTLCLLATSAVAEEQTVRDKNGNIAGFIEHNGSTTVFRDKNGNRTGSSEERHGVTTLYDKNGNHRGTIQ